jgi:glycosyltransferase involved in cell wall biosynthesis
MLRHVVLITDLSVERDGATAIAFAAMRMLRKNGIQVTYVCGDDGENSELEAMGVRLVAVGGLEIGAAKPVNAVFAGLYNASAARVLRSVIEEVDGEGVIYHVHNWSKILSPSIFRALAGVSERLLISTHDYFLACPNGGYFNFKTRSPCELVPLSLKCIGTNCDRRSYAEKLWRVVRAMMRRGLLDFAGRTPTVLPVHDRMVEQLIRGGISEHSITVLRNPVTPWSESRVPVEKNKKFLFVGRLDHDKGAHLLAQAARDAGVPLQMVGDGPLRPFLEHTYPEVEQMGWQSRERVATIAKSARAVVMPTGSRETFGLVAFEALSSGIPVIISKFAATSDEIVQHNVGFACDPYDSSALTAALRTMAASDDQVFSMSARAWALRDSILLTNQLWGERLIDIYRNAAAVSEAPSGVSSRGF